MKPKKILVLTGDPKTLICHRGELLKSFSRQGLEVVAAAAVPNRDADQFLHDLSGRYETFDMDRTGLNPVADLRAFLDILLLIRREQPDYIFSYAVKSVVYGSLAAKLSGVPHIYALVPGLGYAFTPDGTWKQRLVSWSTTFLYGIALRCVDKVFLQNRDDEELLRDRHILPPHVPSYVTNGSGVVLEDFRWKTMTRSDKPRKGKLRFVLISRLLKKKGIAEYVQAARLLKHRYPDAEFDLVGPLDSSPDGVSEADILSWSDQGDVNYHGATQDVISHLQNADVFVLPTYYREGVPRCILEALSIGLPVLTTDAVGSRETVELNEKGRMQRDIGAPMREGTNGILVRPKNLSALIFAMDRLLTKSSSEIAAMGKASRQFAEQRFDVHALNQEILSEMGLVSQEAEHSHSGGLELAST